MSTEFPTLLGSTCTKDVEGKDDKLGPRVHISVTNTFVELHEEKAARQAKHKTFRRASTAPVGESPDTDDDELDMGRCKSEAHAYTKLTEKCELAAVRDQEASASAQEAERSTRSDSPKPSSEKKCAHGPAFNAASSSEAGTSALKDERPTSSMSESCTVDAEDDVPAASPGHELASLAPNRHVMFSVKNTFIQVSESDDESPSAAQPVVRRAETCPLGLQACEEGTDAVGGLSRTGSHHSEESMETDVVRRRNNFHDATCCEDTPCCVDELAGKWSADLSPPSPLHALMDFGSSSSHAFQLRTRSFKSPRVMPTTSHRLARSLSHVARRQSLFVSRTTPKTATWAGCQPSRVNIRKRIEILRRARFLAECGSFLRRPKAAGQCNVSWRRLNPRRSDKRLRRNCMGMSGLLCTILRPTMSFRSAS
eukprot:TRINITY_DN2532_c0_g1_i4.p1 TRINITY_DN2532_c0_g1~~TRINITY_DN2532_c0_g1_i4.p1  ORF type:complete len:436 (+),score=61.43 TRINITY_DN2532_c0_g1_i4:36-1310(+)